MLQQKYTCLLKYLLFKDKLLGLQKVFKLQQIFTLIIVLHYNEVNNKCYIISKLVSSTLSGCITFETTNHEILKHRSSQTALGCLIKYICVLIIKIFKKISENQFSSDSLLFLLTTINQTPHLTNNLIQPLL